MTLLIKPVDQPHVIVEELLTYKNSESDTLHIRWLGQSGFLLQTEGITLLMDPYLSDSLTKKYHNTEKPHERMSICCVQPEALVGIDIVTSSHNHTDHLDAETLIPILKNNPEAHFILPEANKEFAANRLGVAANKFQGINEGQSIKLNSVKFHGIPSAHNEIERDDHGRCLYMGFVVQIGPWTVYHSGDTLLFDGLEGMLSKFSPDVVLLPINGNVPSRGVAGNMNGLEAAHLAKASGAKLVIPHHYHLFKFNSEEPDLFEQSCSDLNQAFYTMKIGERIELDK